MFGLPVVWLHVSATPQIINLCSVKEHDMRWIACLMFLWGTFLIDNEQVYV